MKHIKQRTGWDCGIASAACIAGCSYSVAARFAPASVHISGIDPLQMLSMLRALTGYHWSIIDGRGIPLRELELPGYCMVWIDGGRAWIGDRAVMHVIVYDRGTIYDPGHVIKRNLAQYHKRHWSIAYFFVASRRAARKAAD